MTPSSRVVELSHGPLRFTAKSFGEGPLVLFLHGFPDNAGSFRHQLPAFAEAGFRAVAVNLRGYEPASQPSDGDYTREALARDVLAMLDQLDARRAHLVGHDWGAVVGYTVGALAPERLASLTAICVPHPGRFVNEVARHPRQLALSWYMAFFQLRGISEHVVRRNDYRFIRRLWRRWSPGWDIPGDVLDDVIATLRRPGVTEAALSYYRANAGPRAFTPGARAAVRFVVPVPTLAITGEREGCIAATVFERMMYAEDFPAGHELRCVREAGHFPHQERPSEVNALLLEWVRRHHARVTA